MQITKGNCLVADLICSLLQTLSYIKKMQLSALLRHFSVSFLQIPRNPLFSPNFQDSILFFQVSLSLSLFCLSSDCFSVFIFFLLSVEFDCRFLGFWFCFSVDLSSDCSFGVLGFWVFFPLFVLNFLEQFFCVKSTVILEFWKLFWTKLVV